MGLAQLAKFDLDARPRAMGHLGERSHSGSHAHVAGPYARCAVCTLGCIGVRWIPRHRPKWRQNGYEPVEAAEANADREPLAEATVVQRRQKLVIGRSPAAARIEACFGQEKRSR